ncbi:MAG: hypothetical protein RL660_3045 [Bacteroidota bacterium]|jgi:hypothetical protein
MQLNMLICKQKICLFFVVTAFASCDFSDHSNTKKLDAITITATQYLRFAQCTIAIDDSLAIVKSVNFNLQVAQDTSYTTTYIKDTNKLGAIKRLIQNFEKVDLPPAINLLLPPKANVVTLQCTKRGITSGVKSFNCASLQQHGVVVSSDLNVLLFTFAHCCDLSRSTFTCLCQQDN